MGAKLCSCEGDDNINNVDKKNKPKKEMNLSKIERYSYMKETLNTQPFENDFRTKAGTEWEKISGLEKIILLYKINYIIKRFREYLKRKKKREN